ncbi:MAG: hypothetical protein EA356_08050 [Geminicoccaceae bacterium]|nr:MAG: hypothetical protein EA356_08050 [Geminicoccaceae bacterium]
MPDQTGRLSAEDRKLILNWLQSKGKNHDCPVCSSNKWMIGDHLIAGRIHALDPHAIARENYPQVVLVCTNCAHTRYFMAVPMGLVLANDLGP